MLMLGSGYKYRLSLAEKFDCTETIINQLLAGSHQNPISEWQVTIKLHLVADLKSESDVYFNPCMACTSFYLPLLSVPLSRTVHLGLGHSFGKATY